MSDNPRAVMIFAAGFGTRMRPLTDDRPKPMIKLGGRPLIDRALDWIEAVAPDRIVVNTHYRPEMLEAHLATRNLTVLREEPEILDTGGGLRNALPVLGAGPVITVNPDTLWLGPNPVLLALDAWRPDRMDALLVCTPRDRVHGTDRPGDFGIDPEGLLQRGPGYFYGGVQILKTDGLAAIPDPNPAGASECDRSGPRA